MAGERLGGAFDRFWGATLLANLGDGLVWTAAPLLAVWLTHDPLAVSAISAASYLPWLLCGVAAGVVADRTDRRRLLGGGNVVRTTVLLVACGFVAAGRMPVWGLVALVLAGGVVETFAESANQALVSAVVPAEGLDTANSRLQAGTQVAQGFVAPIGGAALLGVVVVAPFAVSAASFVGAALLAVTLPRRVGRVAGAGPERREPFVRQLDDGARLLWRDRPLRTLLLVTAASAVTISVAQASLVLYLVRTLGLGDAVVGRGVRRHDDGGRGRQRAHRDAAPGGRADALLGRVTGTWRTLCWALVPVATLAGGALARGGLRVPLVVGGLLTVALAVGTAGTVVRAARTAGLVARPPSPTMDGYPRPQVVDACPKTCSQVPGKTSPKSRSERGPAQVRASRRRSL